MANGKQLWELSQARLKSATTLMEASDWDAAAYMMGYALETALKAACCRSLDLNEYPDKTNIKMTNNYFMTHNFSQLLTISGFSKQFEASGPPELSSKWSEFLQYYPPNWTIMRYEPDTIVNFNSINTSRLYEILYTAEDSIINTIKANQKW